MQDLARATRIAPGSKVDLDAHKPDGKLGLRNEQTARARTAKRAERMAELATKLMAEHRRSVLVVLQGMDTSGKDGTIKHCFGGLNPLGVRVAGFKAPSSTELAHDFLWRVHQVLPERGEIGIFNRSHYEDVLVVRVEELVPKAGLEAALRGHQRLRAEPGQRGHEVVKLFLHISKEEQAERLRERIADPQEELEVLAPTTSTSARTGTTTWMPTGRCSADLDQAAPWYVVPADHKWVRDAVVTEVLTQTLEGLDLKWPELAPELRDLVVD